MLGNFHCPEGRPAVRHGDSGDAFLVIIAVVLLLVVVIGLFLGLSAWKRSQEEVQHAMAEADIMDSEWDHRSLEEQAEKPRRLAEENIKRKLPSKPLPRFLFQQRWQTLCQEGKIDEGLLWMTRGVETMGGKADWQHFLRLNLAAWGQPQTPPRELVRSSESLTVLALSPDGKTLATASSGGQLQLRQAETGQTISEPLKLDAPAQALAFSPDGKTILVADGIGQLRSLEVANRRWAAEVDKLPGLGLAVSFPNKGQPSQAGTCDQGVWVQEGGQPAIKLFTPSRPVRALALSPVGGMLATGHDDGSCSLFQRSDAKEPERTVKNDNPVGALAFSADGKLLAIGTSDSVRLWDVALLQPIGPVLAKASVLCVVFSADGKRLLSSDKDGIVQVWTLPRPMEGSSERLTLWTQVRTGKELDAQGDVNSLSPGILEQRRRRLLELGSPLKP